MIRDRQDNYIKHGLSYDDVLLVPKYSDISSRSEINLVSELGNDLTLY